MIGVGFRAKRDAEAAAARLVSIAQEAADILILRVPAIEDGDAAAVVEHECCDVDGVGAAMLAKLPAGPAVDGAAGIGAEALDSSDAALQPPLGGGLQRLAGPTPELPRQRASHRSEISHRGADVAQLHRADRRAAIVEDSICQDPELDRFAAEVGMALERGFGRLGGEGGTRPFRGIDLRDAAGEEQQGQEQRLTHVGRLIRATAVVNGGGCCCKPFATSYHGFVPRLIAKFVNSKPLVWAFLSLPALLMIRTWLTDPEIWPGDLLHPSGEWSARLIIFALMLTPLSAIFRGRRWVAWLIRRRRAFGVAGFGYALLHLFFYVLDMETVGNVLAEIGSLGIWTGWAAFFLFLPLALTSNDASMRALKGGWKKLQRLAYPAAVLTLVHWMFVHDNVAAALLNFAPLAFLQAWRLALFFRGRSSLDSESNQGVKA